MRLLPNPVVDLLTLQLRLPEAGQARLSVFDVAGREVAPVLDGSLTAGGHAVSWKAAPAQAGGVYYARLATSRGMRTEPFILLR